MWCTEILSSVIFMEGSDMLQSLHNNRNIYTQLSNTFISQIKGSCLWFNCDVLYIVTTVFQVCWCTTHSNWISYNYYAYAYNFYWLWQQKTNAFRLSYYLHSLYIDTQCQLSIMGLNLYVISILCLKTLI